jgi:hypothetical protein
MTRTGHPETSQIAAQKMADSGKLARDRMLALDAVRRHPGLTGYELDKVENVHDGERRKRLSELKSLGFLVVGPKKVCSVFGGVCQTWWTVDHPKVLSGEIGRCREDGVIISERFDKFWNAYPRRVSRKMARVAFLRLAPTEELLAAMLESLNRYKGNTRDKGGWKDAKTGKLIDKEFIPHAATWLNAERWTDELPPVEEQTKLSIDEKVERQRQRFRTELSEEEIRKRDEVWKRYRKNKNDSSHQSGGTGQAQGGVAGEEHQQCQAGLHPQENC